MSNLTENKKNTCISIHRCRFNIDYNKILHKKMKCYGYIDPFCYFAEVNLSNIFDLNENNYPFIFDNCKIGNLYILEKNTPYIYQCLYANCFSNLDDVNHADHAFYDSNSLYINSYDFNYIKTLLKSERFDIELTYFCDKANPCNINKDKLQYQLNKMNLYCMF